MSDLGTPALLAIFLAAALATWVAGVNLAKATRHRPSPAQVRGRPSLAPRARVVLVDRS